MTVNINKSESKFFPAISFINIIDLFCFVQVRSMISDFAVFLTIVIMVLLDYCIGVPTQKLQVPSKFQVGHLYLHPMQL